MASASDAAVAIVQRPASSPADALRDLLSAPPQLQAAALPAGAVVHLVKLLAASEGRLQENAVGLLSQLVQGPEAAQAAAVDAGVIEGLVRVLTAENTTRTKQLAMLTLRRVVDGHVDNQVAAVEAGAIAALVKLMSDFGQSSVAAADAALTLACVVDGSDEAQADAAVHGTCGALVHLLQQGVGDGRANAAKALGSLVHGNVAAQQAALDGGAIAGLIELLNSDTTGEKIEACRALAFLTRKNAPARKLATSAGAVPVLLSLIRSSAEDDQAANSAALELGNLILNNRRQEPNRVDAASIGGFVEFLRSEVRFETTEASLALAHIVENNTEAQDQAIEGGAIPRLLNRLQLYSGRGDEIVNDLHALANLTQGNEIAKEAVADSGVVIRVIGIVRESSEDAQCNALHLLSSMVEDDEGVGAAAVSAGLVNTSVGLLATPKTCSAAAEFLARLLYLARRLYDDFPAEEAAREAGALVALTRVLSEGPSEATANAALALSELVGTDAASKSVLLGLNGVGLLVELLDTKKTDNVEAAATALACLAYGDPVSRDAVVDGNAIAAMLDAIRSDVEMEMSVSVVTLDMVADILTRCPRAQARALEDGAVVVMAQLLKSGSLEEKETSARVLGHLVDSFPPAQAAVLKAELVPILVEHVLDESMDVQSALRVLRHLSESNASYQESCMAAGAIPAVLSMLKRRDDLAVPNALFALEALITKNAGAQDQAVASGALSCLASYLSDDPETVAAFAVSVLNHLSGYDPADFIEADGILLLVDLLHSDQIDAELSALDLLNELVNRHPNTRALVVEAGAITALVEVFQANNEIKTQKAGQALALLVENDAIAEDQAVHAGAISCLVAKIQNPGALRALTAIVKGHQEAQEQLLETEVLQRLFEYVNDQSESVRIDALALLNSAISGSGQEEPTTVCAMKFLLWVLQRAFQESKGDAAVVFANLLEANAAVLAKEAVTDGAVGILSDLLDVETSDEMVKAAEALHYLAMAEPLAVELLLETRVVERVVGFICEGVCENKSNGLLSLSWLVKENQGLGAAASDAGALNMLFESIEIDDDDVKMVTMLVIQNLVESCDSALASVRSKGVMELLVSAMRGPSRDLILCTRFAVGEIIDRSDAGAISNETILDIVDAVIEAISKLEGDDADAGYATGTLVSMLVINNRAAQETVLKNGMLTCFVDFLREGSVAAKLGSAVAVSGLAKNQPDAQRELVEGGVLSVLIELMRDYDGYEVVAAVDALGNIVACDNAYQMIVLEGGAVPILVDFLKNDEDDVVSSAGLALSCLVCGNENSTRTVVDAGAFELVTKGFKSTTSENKVYCAMALLGFFRASPSRRSPALEDEVLSCLVETMRVEEDDETRADIVEALGNFVENDRANQDAVVRAGIMDPLVDIIQSSRRDTRTKAITALNCLIAKNDAAQTAAVAAGAVGCLVGTISAGGDTVRSNAAALALTLLAEGRPAGLHHVFQVLEGAITTNPT